MDMLNSLCLAWLRLNENPTISADSLRFNDLTLLTILSPAPSRSGTLSNGCLIKLATACKNFNPRKAKMRPLKRCPVTKLKLVSP